jgi:hypothetical protein
MPDTEAVAELRSLQERAYGRAGGLSDAEAARLKELQELRLVAVVAGRPLETASGVAPVVGRGSEATEDPPLVGRGSEATERRAERAERVEVTKRGFLRRLQGTGDASPPARSTIGLIRGLRARSLALAAAVIVAVLVGVLIGWVVFAPRTPHAVPLSAEQQSWQDEILVSAVYDPGSVRAIGEEDGTIVWFATRDDGAIVCAIIGDGVTTAPACRERDIAMMQGVQTSLRRAVEGGEGLVEAQVQFDAEGDPAVLSSSSLIGGDAGGAYATEEEHATAALLTEGGYAPTSLTVVGHDGDVPIWIGLHLDADRWCLIYDGSAAPVEAACDDGAALNGGGTLELTHLDFTAGTSTTIEYRFGPGSPYLEITRNHDDAAS